MSLGGDDDYYEPPLSDLFPPFPNLSGKPSRQLGPYPNCVHHYSGLSSTIYLTPSPSNPAQVFALKLCNPSHEQAPHDSRKESRLLSRLSHPNIIPLIANHPLPNSTSFILTFPFAPLTLSDLLRTSSTQIPLSILSNIFSGLSQLHSLSIIHRDIKPANILLSSPTGPAQLCDLGIAWSPSDPASEPADKKITDVGTTCYRPPELLFGKRDYGPALDLWAAGCVAAEIFMHNAEPRHSDGEDEDGWTLFDAGDLGSELALVKSIFETLGTPNAEVWPECMGLPDWGKMTFVKFEAKGWEEILPGVADEHRSIVKGLVRFESNERIPATDVNKMVK